MRLDFKQHTQGLPQTTVLVLDKSDFITNFSIKNDSFGSRKFF